MDALPSFRITIGFSDPELDKEERDEEVIMLLRQLREFDDVIADRVADPNPPEGNKAAAGFLVGLLTAEVNAENANKVFRFLHNRLSGKPIELEVERSDENGESKKLKIKANNAAELEFVFQQAKAFIDG